MAQNERRITRRDFLKTGITVVPVVGFGLQASAALTGSTAAHDRPKNVLLFITDQQRAIQHFPPNWEEQNLPGVTRLKAHGLSFESAFTNACMCSPARSTLMTGFFPAQHGVKYTLEEDMPASQYPQVELPLDLKNIASVMSAAGHTVVFKGKWHCSKPNGKHWVRNDLRRYGFQRWEPAGCWRQSRH
jgi:arylsulfatase A-like enzyme